VVKNKKKRQQNISLPQTTISDNSGSLTIRIWYMIIQFKTTTMHMIGLLWE